MEHVASCTLCPWRESWTTQAAAEAAAVWHVYDDHHSVWTELQGTALRPPVNKMPEDYGRRLRGMGVTGMICTIPFGPDHPEFVLKAYPGGVIDLAVCWDSTNIREISEELRQVADRLDELPEDTEAVGVRPL
jgi:hypothetical protein